MKDISIERELVDEFSKLSTEQKKRLLNYARSLSGVSTTGVAGKTLLKFQSTIPPLELELISKAIEEDCEKINPNEW
jgi:hypothetical protein